MLTPQELRIGNYYWTWISYSQLRTDNIFCVVESIGKFQDYSNCHGIPLTQEWLDKIKPNYKIFFFKPEANKIFIQIDNIKIEIYNATLEIKYVHQLQNLFFTLTNKELCITP